MKQSALLEFESSAFSREAGEDALTNPGVFGKALASWLATELSRQDFFPGDVFPEDFGWCFSVGSKPYALYVACASIPDESDKWQVFVFSESWFIRRLLGKNHGSESIVSLLATVKQLLQRTDSVEALRELPI
ncbi:hypothetical protein BCF11_3681 [Collimonas sp. PA-H2]|uniref:hypothetical protein n=1 Tax=Collimonas sp. PA-H2 TaxID=1881062 RepID=UPI000C019840|nr:hypothetical protein [Collimonas sp. PA-H2]PFH11237.1 hypothetical protein BCF11_3681 [Collimonas sp. PA-H2]